MEAILGILRRGYEKRRSRDVARQAPSLRTEWVGWPHLAFRHWTSHDHEWDPSGPPSTGGRKGPAARGTGRIAGNCGLHPAPNTPPTAYHATRLLWLSKEILRSLRACQTRPDLGPAVRLRSGNISGPAHRQSEAPDQGVRCALEQNSCARSQAIESSSGMT